MEDEQRRFALAQKRTEFEVKQAHFLTSLSADLPTGVKVAQIANTFRLFCNFQVIIYFCAML